MDVIRLGAPGAPAAAGSAGDGAGSGEPDPLEPDGGVVPQSVYWLRRGIALVVGIGLLALLAWAVNGTLSGGASSGGPGGSVSRLGRPLSPP